MHGPGRFASEKEEISLRCRLPGGRTISGLFSRLWTMLFKGLYFFPTCPIINPGAIMRCHFAVLLLSTLVGACGGQSGQRYSVYFQPYSAGFDPQAQQVIHEAATFAKAHPLLPLSIKNTTPYMGVQVDTLSGQRTEAVLHALLQEGISR